MATLQRVKPALGTSEFTKRVGKTRIFVLALAPPREKHTCETRQAIPTLPNNKKLTYSLKYGENVFYSQFIVTQLFT